MQKGAQMPDGDRRAVYNHLARHYEDFEEEAPAFESENAGGDLMNEGGTWEGDHEERPYGAGAGGGLRRGSGNRKAKIWATSKKAAVTANSTW